MARIALLMALTATTLSSWAQGVNPDTERQPQHPPFPLFCPKIPNSRDYSPMAIKCRMKAAFESPEARQLHAPQSNTPKAAVAEYRRRYSRKPPTGFEDWAKMAIEHGSRVDDFDHMDRDLKPYRSKEAKEIFRQLGESNSINWEREWPEMMRITITDGDAERENPNIGGYHRHFPAMWDPFAHKLPNNTVFYVNIKCEPRVLRRSGGRPRPQKLVYKEITFREDLADILQKSCTFVPTDVSAAIPATQDLCKVSNMGWKHGLAASPAGMASTYSLAPAFSTGRTTSFADIVYPAPCYWERPVLDKPELADLPSWEEKKRQVYWRGSFTGQFARADKRWRNGHRHRFVQLVNNITGPGTAYQVPAPSSISYPIMPAAEEKAIFARSFDVWFATEYNACEPAECAEMKSIYGALDTQPEDKANEYRFLFDIDGHSMSMSFHRHLSREALVFKQTVYQEWSDGLLIPWLHYVPVSMDMTELAALTNFFVESDEGDRWAKWIAQQGAARARKTLRKIDMSLYWYRLLLEYADMFGN